MRTLAARNERLVARLEDEARVDPLTGLLNRRGLEERLGAEVSRAARDRSPLGAVTFDLDHFKRVNDEHGHEIGDRVLAWFGALLTEQARGVDIAARVGGEEFVVLLPGADADAARTFAERVRLAVCERGGDSDRARMGISDSLRLTVSAGVVGGRGAGRRPGAAGGGGPGALRGEAGRSQPHRGRPPRGTRGGHGGRLGG